MTCLQSFLLENVTMVLLLCFFRRWQALILSPVMSTPVWWSTLQTVGSSSLSSIDEGNPTTSRRSRHNYWAFFQHCFSIDDICLDRILFASISLNMLIWAYNLTKNRITRSFIKNRITRSNISLEIHPASSG